MGILVGIFAGYIFVYLPMVMFYSAWRKRYVLWRYARPMLRRSLLAMAEIVSTRQGKLRFLGLSTISGPLVVGTLAGGAWLSAVVNSRIAANLTGQGQVEAISPTFFGEIHWSITVGIILSLVSVCSTVLIGFNAGRIAQKLGR